MGNYNLKLLLSIAPSKVEALSNCAYQVALSANVNRLKLPTLPPSPYAVMGKLVHKMYQEIFTGKIADTVKFDDCWNENEKRLEKKYYRSFEGVLKKCVNDYVVKKITCKRIISNKYSSQSTYRKRVEVEKKFISNEGHVLGIADLIIENGDNVKIIDHKTGRFLEQGGRVKEGYTKQLKLYAHLYYLSNGKYPNELIIKDMFGNSYEIPFTPNECADLYNWVLSKLNDLNTYISSGLGEESIANPSTHLCKNCDLRISCKFYYGLSDKSSNDLIAKPTAVRLINNKLNIAIDVMGRQKIIKGLHSFPEDLINKNLLFFNLKLGRDGLYYASYNTAYLER